MSRWSLSYSSSNLHSRSPMRRNRHNLTARNPEQNWLRRSAPSPSLQCECEQLHSRILRDTAIQVCEQPPRTTWRQHKMDHKHQPLTTQMWQHPVSDKTASISELRLGFQTERDGSFQVVERKQERCVSTSTWLEREIFIFSLLQKRSIKTIAESWMLGSLCPNEAPLNRKGMLVSLFATFPRCL